MTRRSAFLHSRYSRFSMTTTLPCLAGLVLTFTTCVERPSASAAEAPIPQPTAREYAELADHLETYCFERLLPFWYPRCVDREYGGFLPHVRHDNTPGENNDKTIVFQARMTWTAAAVMLHSSERADEFRPFVEHGIRFLQQTMWDDRDGGFYWGLDRRGNPIPRYGTEKHLYGTSFGMYAAATAYRAAQSPEALQLAQDTFRWLEAHAHDPSYGGYFEAFHRSGRPILESPKPGTNGRQNTERDLLGTPYGYKSMNSHIHLLEALTELYRVWPDPGVRRRLDEVFRIVRDKIVVEPGCMNLYFTRDWRAVPDHDSFGHDVETAYLLLEAAEVMGLAHDPKTLTVARSLVDHALQYGWDEKQGGFYDRGFAFQPAYALDKVWWTQAEGLNALLLMHERFPAPDAVYWNAFYRQWRFIEAHQIHPLYGEWYATVTEDGPDESADLAQVWKGPYHNTRAILNTIERLRRLAAANETSDDSH